MSTDNSHSDMPETETTPGRLRRGSIGVVSVAAALAAQELAAGIIRPLPSLMAGTAEWVIDVVPVSVSDWAIATLQFWTKPTLIIGVTTVLVLAGIVVSQFSRVVRSIAYGGVGLIGAIVTTLGGSALWASLASAAVAVGAGLITDDRLRSLVGPPHLASRRVFVASIASMSILAVTGALIGRDLIDRGLRRLARRDEVVLPDAIAPARPVTAVHQFEIEGLESVVTPNDRFFTVDITALNPPEIDLSNWTLTIGGMVERELTFTYQDLLDMDLVEHYATLACVSNKVGGRLVGHALWRGIPFSRLLEMAGALPTAEQVAATGADGFSTGFPLAAVYDRETLLAIGMNGEPLPYRHGFPARMVVPGYFGFVSAAKWLERIELTTWDDHDSYWAKLGWAKYAPVETQSRIDAPRDNMSFAAGPRMVAGVAWAPYLGIERVEVSIDDGPWVDAELSEPLGDASWVQWRLPWDAPVGEHTIAVRATDGSGAVQTADERRPIPDGATGHHTIQVRAE